MNNSQHNTSVAAQGRPTDEFCDIELSKWASYQLWRLRKREIQRGAIEQALHIMPAAKQKRARFWLNHYREGRCA